MVHSTSVAIACLAGSLGLGGIWTKVHSHVEVVVTHTSATTEPTLMSEYAESSMAAHTSSAQTLVEGQAIEDSTDLATSQEQAETVKMEGSWAVCWIVLSLSLDALCLALGWRGFKFCDKRRRATESIGDDGAALETDSETEFYNDSVKDLGELMQRSWGDGVEVTGDTALSAEAVDAMESEQPQLGLAAFLPSITQQAEEEDAVADVPRVSSRRKSAGELKAWMEKQHDQCEIVENMQTLIETDAKAPTSPDRGEEYLFADDASPEKVSPPQKAVRRSAGELKALMEKKRDECHVVEGTQDHIETDAKTDQKSWLESDAVLRQADGHSNLPPVPRAGRSNKEVQDLMMKLKNQCIVSEGPDAEVVATDAKAQYHVHPVATSVDKENCGY